MRAPHLLICVGLLWACSAVSKPSEPEQVHSENPPTWFEDGKSLLSISDDGRWAVYRGRRRVELIDLQYGARDPWRLYGTLDEVVDARFYGGGRLARSGRRGEEEGWFLEAGGGLQLSVAAPGSQPAWWSGGDGIAFSQGDTLYILAGAKRLSFQTGAVGALAWSSDGQEVHALVYGDDGLSSLVVFDLATEASRNLATGLDTSASHNSIALTQDGRYLYVALASPGAPDPSLRHQPDADRDLDIYQVDTATGELQVLVQMPGDDLAPVVAGNHLYWTHNRVRESVAVVPMTGGESRIVIYNGQIPAWKPDGSQLAYSRGGWRVADWALNIDASVVDVDGQGRATSPPRDIITGYHEDFTPVWSPDGQWMAYHSHRSPTPVTGYASPGSTDDIYIKRDSAPMEEEIRLTNFGWEIGMADWSPDGRQLVFSSWDRGAPLINRPWIVTIDPETGSALSTERLPLPEQVTNAHWLSWSPVGNEIAIEAVLEGEGRELWVVNAEDGTGERIAEYRASTYGGLDWTPDGKTLVYSGLAGERMQIFAVPRAGGEPQQLTTDSANLMHPQVSPDGRHVACTRILWSKEIWRLRLDR